MSKSSSSSFALLGGEEDFHAIWNSNLSDVTSHDDVKLFLYSDENFPSSPRRLIYSMYPAQLSFFCLSARVWPNNDFESWQHDEFRQSTPIKVSLVVCLMIHNLIKSDVTKALSSIMIKVKWARWQSVMRIARMGREKHTIMHVNSANNRRADDHSQFHLPQHKLILIH